MSILNSAIKNRDIDLLRKAIHSGESANSMLKNGDVDTLAIAECIWNNFPLGAQVLITEFGADPTLPVHGDTQRSFVFFLPDAAANGLLSVGDCLEFFKLFVAINPEILQVRLDGITLLSDLLRQTPFDDDYDDCFELLDGLIQIGCNPTTLNEDGSGLLFGLCSYAPRIVDYLLDQGVDVNAGNKQRTPLHCLVAQQDSMDHGLLAMLEAGAVVNAADEYGRTPIDYLIYPMLRPYANQLLDFGATPTTYYQHSIKALQLQVLAESGDIDAMEELGKLLADEDSPIYDQEKASDWKLETTSSIVSKLQAFLDAYSGLKENPGVIRNKYDKCSTEALRLQPLAESGDDDAQYELGELFADEDSPIFNPVKAAHWHLAAANSGLAQAQVSIGQMYLDGFGVEVNPSEALRWLKLAAEKNHLIANYKIAEAYANGALSSDLPDEAAKWYRPLVEEKSFLIHQEIVQWHIEASSLGGVEASCNLGLMYQYGIHLAKDFKKALACFLYAAERKNGYAYWYLSDLYSDGLLTKKDPVEVVKWRKLAAQCNDLPKHMRLLADMFSGL